MFFKPSGFLAKDFIAKRKLFCFPALALTICASTGWAQAPSVVITAQQSIGTVAKGAQGIAVSKNGTVFISDTNNNQILARNPQTGVIAPVSTGAITLTFPTPIALDANGNLFVGDTPSGIGGRIVKLAGDGNGNLTGAASTVFSGTPLTNPFGLTVDSAGTLFIGDYSLDTGNGAIYSLASGGATLTPLSFSGLPTQFAPGSLFRAGNNLYIADNGNGNTSIGGVWFAPATGGNAQKVSTFSFSITNPTGVRLDAAGNIYILTYLTTGPGFNSGQQIVVVPAASPGSPYILPNSGILYGTDMGFDPAGNIDVVDYAGGAVVQLSQNPVNMGKNSVGSSGSPIQFNFEFNEATTLRGFRAVTQGDVSQEITQSTGGTCTNGRHTNLGTGGPTISPFFPYTCVENFFGTPTYPGVRASAIQVKGANTAILGSQPVYQTGLAGAEVTYPVNQRETATGLQDAQAVVISGLDKTVYVSDPSSGVVFSAAGLGGSALTPVSTGAVSLSAPYGLALDGAGNLFITDFDNAKLVEVPTTTGLPASVVNTGGLLQHPISVAFDSRGNTYIGDAGPAGLGAGFSNPGYVVKIPLGGSPFKMTIPSVPIAFPQALATDPITDALLIGDGGNFDFSGVQVVQVSADGTTASVKPINNLTNPSGLAFDPGGQLYVADQFSNTVIVVPPTGDTHLVTFNNSNLSQTVALGISAGGQSFVLANFIDNTHTTLVFLNGNRSTAAFGGVKVGFPSQTQTATEYNIGNLPLTLSSPFFTTNGVNAAFTVLGSSTCGNGSVLDSAASCDINLQFKPTNIGQTTQQLTVRSDAYNGGSGAINAPILTLRGTGDAVINRRPPPQR
jgi:sugar lactone lactonase YvrE